MRNKNNNQTLIKYASELQQNTTPKRRISRADKIRNKRNRFRLAKLLKRRITQPRD